MTRNDISQDHLSVPNFIHSALNIPLHAIREVIPAFALTAPAPQFFIISLNPSSASFCSFLRLFTLHGCCPERGVWGRGARAGVRGAGSARSRRPARASRQPAPPASGARRAAFRSPRPRHRPAPSNSGRPRPPPAGDRHPPPGTRRPRSGSSR